MVESASGESTTGERGSGYRSGSHARRGERVDKRKAIEERRGGRGGGVKEEGKKRRRRSNGKKGNAAQENAFLSPPSAIARHAQASGQQ